jgi:AcrR family transcriptional regulator
MRDALSHTPISLTVSARRNELTMSKDMSATGLNKHALRTKETRGQLLRAAEVIFVRDGFEKADLSAIAAAAGRTRGAIYAQFKSKEDVFLALMEEKTQEIRAKMEEILSASHSPEQNLKAYQQFWIGMIEDPGWSLLLLEFKLFIRRHPESKERLKKYYDTVFPADHEKKLVALLGSPGRGQDTLSRSVAIQSLQPLISALAIEVGLAPSLGKDMVGKVAARIFNALLQPPAQK